MDIWQPRLLISQKDGGTALLALGGVAHQAALMALGLKRKAYPFGHGAVHEFTACWHPIA